MNKEDVDRDVHYTSCVIRDNTEFLISKTADGYNEIIALIDDAWAYLGIFMEKKSWTQDYSKYAMLYFGSHVLSPLSFAIRIDLQVGNLPACFFELRMILESMSKCYWADLQYKESEHFMDKLQLLEKRINKRETSTAKLLKTMGHEYSALWGKLSEDWMHSEDYFRRILEYTTERNCVPGYALGSPMDYGEDDIDLINELCASVSKYRTLLKETTSKWRKATEL
jgi:hypothetical protein